MPHRLLNVPGAGRRIRSPANRTAAKAVALAEALAGRAPVAGCGLDELAGRLGAEMGNPYFMEQFHSVNDFLERGEGVCVLHEGRVVCAATSAAASSMKTANRISSG